MSALPLRWAVEDRCVVEGHVGVVKYIGSSGFVLVRMEAQHQQWWTARLSDLGLVPFAKATTRSKRPEIRIARDPRMTCSTCGARAKAAVVVCQPRGHITLCGSCARRVGLAAKRLVKKGPANES